MKKTTRNIYFFLRNFVKIHNGLKLLCVKNIRVFKFKNWHHGYCYFSAYTNNNTKVFIKIDTKLLILENEYIVYEQLKHVKNINLIRVLKFIKKENLQIIALEFIEAQELTRKDILKVPSIAKNIYDVLTTLSVHNIIHRDIRLENFLLCRDSLYIIDFSFANNIKKTNSLLKELPSTYENYLILDGLGYKVYENKLEWNDFYSAGRIINELITKDDDLMNTNTKEYLEKIMVFFNEGIIGHSYNCDQLFKKWNRLWEIDFTG